ncbi:hypothetical protein HMF7854_12205 [Sphingomonas ginkgonis]|uniref:Cellulose biosynthesis protein BcsS n=1 Tax=Sphingomonas ginkgonis TaxID=2315330 RepID=A0A429VC13_9SPHN|nr:TorF family putative porin [Sphingomonas ginkgonis]RST31518.1 hypothetical protein HMF7854_12205 [Sphingomonas ginkgonis]
MKSLLLPAAVLVAVVPAAPAFAQTEPSNTASGVPTTPAEPPTTSNSPFMISGSAALVSQYRFRGISQSDNKPVVQGSFTLAHRSGFYASVWGSSANANDAVNIGGTEIDVYGGYSHGLGQSGVTVDAGVYGYLYPGSRRAVGISENYYELYASLARSLGPVTAKAGVYWAPSQSYFRRFDTATRYNLYEYAELGTALPGIPLLLHAHVGHSGGGFDYAGHDYVDYTLGASAKWKALTADLSLVGTNLSRHDTSAADLALGTHDFHRSAKPVLVGSLTASF